MFMTVATGSWRGPSVVLAKVFRAHMLFMVSARSTPASLQYRARIRCDGGTSRFVFDDLFVVLIQNRHVFALVCLFI